VPPPHTDAESLADKLIEKVGAEEAIQLTQGRKPNNKRGRTSLESADLWLITLTWALRIEWRKHLPCSPQDRRLPTRHALAQNIVGVFWNDNEMLVPGLIGNTRYGASKEAVVKRLMDRPFWIDNDGECLRRDFGEECFEHFQC